MYHVRVVDTVGWKIQSITFWPFFFQALRLGPLHLRLGRRHPLHPLRRPRHLRRGRLVRPHHLHRHLQDQSLRLRLNRTLPRLLPCCPLGLSRKPCGYGLIRPCSA